jgi:hypothetical protein
MEQNTYINHHHNERTSAHFVLCTIVVRTEQQVRRAGSRSVRGDGVQQCLGRRRFDAPRHAVTTACTTGCESTSVREAAIAAAVSVRLGAAQVLLRVPVNAAAAEVAAGELTAGAW